MNIYSRYVCPKIFKLPDSNPLLYALPQAPWRRLIISFVRPGLYGLQRIDCRHELNTVQFN